MTTMIQGVRRAAACLLLAGTMAQAPAATPSAEQAAQYEKEHAEVVTMLRTESGFEEIDRGEVLQFIDKKRGRVLLATKPGHPAHPALVVREAVEEAGQIFIKSRGTGRGDEKALKTWIDYLDAQAKQDVDAARARGQAGTGANAAPGAASNAQQ